MAAAALSSLSFTGSYITNWNAVVNASSLSSGITNINNITSTFPFSSTIANTSQYGADLMAVVAFNIAASGTLTINLNSFTDVCGRTANSFARIKEWLFVLYGTGQSTPNGLTAGTACASIAVGNAGSNPFSFNFSGSTNTQQVNNSSIWSMADGSANGITTTSANNVLITNNDATYAAVGLAIFVGGHA